MVTTTCDYCGDTFDARRKDARFCTDAHRARATRARNRRDRQRLADLVHEHLEAVQSGDAMKAYDLVREIERLVA